MERDLLNYLQRILTARVYDVAIETDLEKATKLSNRLGNHVWLKREDTQPIRSFKLRGAYNKMACLTSDELAKGVICASAGNHAQGVALSAQRLNCRAVIVMPVTTPRLKSDAVRALGGQVVLHGDSYSDAYAYAMELKEDNDFVFIHPFDDPDVIAGQGTVGMEILRQLQQPIHAIFVAVGGGGLLAGLSAYVKAIRPDIKVIGVQMSDSNAMLQSLEAGVPVSLNDVGLFSDGTAVKRVGDETYRLIKALADGFVTVDTDEVCAAIKDAFEDTRSILEPAGAMGIAGMKQYIQKTGIKDQNLVAVTCGANMNFDRLRFVAERAESGENREALFAVSIPEVKGSFRALCESIGPRNVTEFNYRLSSGERAYVLVGLSIEGKNDVQAVIDSLKAKGFDALNLSEDELAKEHLRHMVGGRSDVGGNERIFRFEFPERPGALLRFLSQMEKDWNISLFHYRNQGADYGKILVGIQFPDSHQTSFQSFVDRLGFTFVEETANPVYQMFWK